MKTNLLKYLFPLLLVTVSLSDGFSQSTIDQIKFEEAEQKYLSGNNTGALILLNELEQKGLKNPKVLHLKILATSTLNSPSYDEVVQFKKDIAYYLNNCDIIGLEDKYKQVYEVEKTLSSPRYNVAALASSKAGEYYKNKDYRNALTWYLKAEELGDNRVDNWFYIGVMLAKGLGTEKNIPDAIKWYTKAGERGSAEAQNNLAIIYQNGEVGMEPNLTEAVKWYTKSAAQGNIAAQTNLGNLYFSGEGVPKDLNKAIEFFQNPADKGNLNAEYYIGVCYATTSPPQAIYWLEKVINNTSQTETRRLSALNMYAEISGLSDIPATFSGAMNWYRAEKEKQRIAKEKKKEEERLAREKREEQKRLEEVRKREAERVAAEKAKRDKQKAELLSERAGLKKQLKKNNGTSWALTALGLATAGGGAGLLYYALDSDLLEDSEVEGIIAVVAGSAGAAFGAIIFGKGLSQFSKSSKLRRDIRRVDTRIGQLSFDYVPGYHGRGFYSHSIGISLTLNR